MSQKKRANNEGKAVQQRLDSFIDRSRLTDSATHDGKFLLDGHNDLYGIEAVQAKVLGEGRGWGDLQRMIRLHNRQLLWPTTFRPQRTYEALTLEGSTFSKLLSTSVIRLWISLLLRPEPLA